MQKTTPITFVGFCLSFALGSCASMPAPTRDGQNVALGQSAYVDGPLVRPVSVIEDSRCPKNVRCIWAGRVRVQMHWLRPNGGKQTFEVELGKPHQLADGQITLTAVHPEKQSDAAIAASDYRFTLLFRGGI